MTAAQKNEYNDLYTRRAELQNLIAARLAGGVQSASISTAGNSQSYTALSLADLRAELAAITRRMLELLGLTRRGCPFVPSLPSFAR